MTDDTVNQCIARLLDRIDAAYPEARKSAIRARMQAFWNGGMCADRLPYAVLVFGGAPQLPADTPARDRELVGQLAAIAAHGEKWDDDFYPALSTGVRQVNLPSYFGCVEEFSSASVKVKPIIRDASDVYSIPTPGFIPGSAGWDTLEKLAHWREKTSGRVSFYEPDMQGPFSVASQVWGIEDFLYACYDEPEAVHHLLSLCTDAAIEYTQKMTDAVDGDMLRFHCQPCLWYPKEKGLAVSEDMVAVVSKETTREFIVPYLARIADAFGGVAVHTCGSMNHVIPTLCAVNKLTGLNFSSAETDVPRAMADKARDVRIVCHNGLLASTGLTRLNPFEHARLLRDLAVQYNEQLFCIQINFDGDLTPADDPKFQELLSI